MLHVYEKVTKDKIDFPAYTLCFLGIIMNKLEFYGLIDGKKGKIDTESPTTLVIPVVSRKFEYCYDGIELIKKTLKRRGFVCDMAHYKTIEIDEKDGTKSKGYSYEYKISKA